MRSLERLSKKNVTPRKAKNFKHISGIPRILNIERPEQFHSAMEHTFHIFVFQEYIHIKKKEDVSFFMRKEETYTRYAIYEVAIIFD